MIRRSSKRGYKTIQALVVSLMVAALLSACSEVPLGPGGGASSFDETAYQDANAYRGGLLYDNWFQTLDTSPPSEQNPLWAQKAEDSTATDQNNSSWRCKTCHGWDYKGASGAYARFNDPAKYTGFPGLFEKRIDVDGEPLTEEHVFDFLQRGAASSFGNTTHAFKDYLQTQDFYDLTKFVMEFGFVDGGSPTTGVAELGAAPFTQSCASVGCHNSPAMRELAISVAIENPTEFIHKAQFGQPGTAMLPPGPGVGLVERAAAKNILKYLQSVDPANNDIGTFNEALYNQAKLANGGLLYDKWWEVAAQNTAPAELHPLWPASVNDKVGASSSWRCKQCHGWDYLGKDGAYATGDNFSGVKGIIASLATPVTYTSPGTVFNFLKTNTQHSFGSILNDSELYDLTLFVTTMRDEAAAEKSTYQYLDNLAKRVKNGVADVDKGKAYYHGDTNTSQQALCSTCHGDDGKLIDFADKQPGVGDDKFLADVAISNPWEFVHKARFGDIDGDTGQIMPGLVDRNDPALQQTQAAIDILAYTQEALAVNYSRAGRLYDNWAVEASVANAPDTTNPMWANTSNTQKTGATTWRCKSCHGWDYLGANGAYGSTSSSYYTGIKGVMTRNRVSKTEVADFIKNGDNAYPDHAFGTFLGDSDIDLLADFITNTNDGIRTFDAELAAANVNNGSVLYKGLSPGNCETCHGADGTLLAPVGDVARTNVPEFLHKVRFGQPGSDMRLEAGLGFEGLTPQQAADVHAYSKTLGQTGGNVGYDSASIVRGGRLYDKWWEEMRATDSSVQAPADVNPLWTLRDPSIPDIQNTPSNPNKRVEYSWRCKTCHGWDYEGIGFNNGIKGASTPDNLLYKMELIKNDQGLNTPELKQNYVFSWIKSGLSTELHNFGTARGAIPSAMSDAEVWDLVKFLLEGVINTDTYIYETFKTVKGPYKDPDNGLGLYSGAVDPAINCASCHGADGTGVESQGTAGLDIFEIAADDPWEFLHKVRFGQPNTGMPAFLNPTNEHSTFHALHVLDYSQDQFNSRPGLAIQIQ